MGRAIVRQPEAYLMDEPLSNLDAKLRVHMRAEIASLQNELGVTTIYVTHDQVEAMTMGDRVAVMRKGRLQQVAPPQELYERPVNLFVGGFIGSPAMNLVEATIVENGRPYVQIGDHRLALSDELLAFRPRLREYVGRKVVVGIRPENLEDAALVDDAPEDQRLRGVVVLREPLGSEIVAHFTVNAPPALTEDVRELARDVGQETTVKVPGSESEQETVMVGRFGPRSRIKSGQTVDVAVETGAFHFFDLESGLGIYGATTDRGRATERSEQEGDKG
jgi:multiple sugar transport system ATP-binding protein